MTAFTRTINPQRVTYPSMPGPLVSVGHSGKLTTRSSGAVGRTWSEIYFFDGATEDGRDFLAQCNNYVHNGTVVTIDHPLCNTLLGAGGGTPLVKGASQTGASIDTDGWPNSTTVLKAGDIVTWASINLVYDVPSDVTSDGTGNATIPINPPILSGGSPADNAVVTITDSVVFTVIVERLEFDESSPNKFVGMTVYFREVP